MLETFEDDKAKGFEVELQISTIVSTQEKITVNLQKLQNLFRMPDTHSLMIVLETLPIVAFFGLQLSG